MPGFICMNITERQVAGVHARGYWNRGSWLTWRIRMRKGLRPNIPGFLPVDYHAKSTQVPFCSRTWTPWFRVGCGLQVHMKNKYNKFYLCVALIWGTVYRTRLAGTPYRFEPENAPENWNSDVDMDLDVFGSVGTFPSITRLNGWSGWTCPATMNVYITLCSVLYTSRTCMWYLWDRISKALAFSFSF